MKTPRRCCDRRSGWDRRRSYSLDYFDYGGRERRGSSSRRKRRGRERRALWSRNDCNVSVYCGWPEEIDKGEASK